MVERRKESSHKTLEEILERRRDIIDAAIVKILKREKEQSLDSIAATVSLWVGEEESSESVGG